MYLIVVMDGNKVKGRKRGMKLLYVLLGVR